MPAVAKVSVRADIINRMQDITDNTGGCGNGLVIREHGIYCIDLANSSNFIIELVYTKLKYNPVK